MVQERLVAHTHGPKMDAGRWVAHTVPFRAFVPDQVAPAELSGSDFISQ
jgi:hypothetical protein